MRQVTHQDEVVEELIYCYTICWDKLFIVNENPMTSNMTSIGYGDTASIHSV